MTENSHKEVSLVHGHISNTPLNVDTTVNLGQITVNSNTLNLSHCQIPNVTELYIISRTDNYRVLNCCAILRGQNSPNSVRWGSVLESFIVCEHLLGDRALKRDYIITIVASEPSAFLHQPVYSGPSDPDKDKAFQQFSKQEAQTHSHTSFRSNAISHSSHCQKDAHAEKPPEATLPSSHLTSDYELTNISQTHHSWS